MPSRCLPGFAPDLIRLDFSQDASGYWALRVWFVDDARYLRADETALYESLTWEEALDVAAASLDGVVATGPTQSALLPPAHLR